MPERGPPKCFKILSGLWKAWELLGLGDDCSVLGVHSHVENIVSVLSICAVVMWKQAVVFVFRLVLFLQ